MIDLQTVIAMRSSDAKIFLKKKLDAMKDSEDKKRCLKHLREPEFCYTLRKGIVNFINTNA